MEAAANIPRGIRVLIADDHRLFSEALEAILTADGRVEVVGHAADGAEAVKLALEVEPDVVLMDISMPVMDSRSDVDRAREAGAAGYVTKDRIAAELIEAILEVARR